MDDQLSFASLDFAAKKKVTKRDVFLAEMSAVVPWGALEAVIEPHYPKVGPQGGRRPFPQYRPCCAFTSCSNGATCQIPRTRKRSTTSSRCARSQASNSAATRSPTRRRSSISAIYRRHDLTKSIFAAVAEHLAAKGELLRGGTIVDATLIAASPSTKNEAQKRDPEMTSSKKGNQWYFGMKVHIGVDAQSGLVHTAGVTTGKVHDAKVMANLIREDDTAVYGDKGYASDEKKRAAETAGVLWR